MRSFVQEKRRGEDPVEVHTRNGDAHLHWAAVQPQSYAHAANRGSVLPGSVSQEPPPSFLTGAPLGTREGEVVEYLRPQAIASSQQIERVPNYGQPVHSRGQARPDSGPHESKTRQPNRQVRVTQGPQKNGMVNRWVNEEVRLSMSKMSIMSLVLGLLFLGALFFIIGFLAAVGTLRSEEVAHRSQGAWEASNAPDQQQHPSKGGKGGGALGALVGGAVGKQLAPLNKALGGTAASVPAPLQPFARYGIGSAQRQVRTTTAAANPFAPQRGNPAQQQQPYGGQQYTGQQYPGGPYPSQPMMQQQGGYPQGYAPQQQPQQQPNYQMPMQQQPMQQQPMQQHTAPQQMMGPQQPQYPQQIQQPQYPQQMMPQQGYYR